MKNICCPQCGSEEVDSERKSEYTGGGFADYWEEYECAKCGHLWESEIRSDYA